MANYAISPNAFEASNQEAALANQLSGPAGNQLLGYLYAARLDREQGTRDYLRAVDASQQRASADSRLKMQYDLAAALGKNPESLMLTHPGRSIVAPEASDIAADYTLTGLEQNRANAFRNYGEGVNQLAYAGVAPPQGSEYTLLGAPKVAPVQGTPIPVQLKGMGSGGGRELSAYQKAMLALGEAKAGNALDAKAASIIEQFAGRTQQAETQYGKAVRDANEAFKFKPQDLARALAAAEAQYKTSLARIDSDRTQALSRLARTDNAAQATATAPATNPAQTAVENPTASPVSKSGRSVDEVIATAKKAYQQAPQNSRVIQDIMKREGVPPERFNEVFGR